MIFETARFIVRGFTADDADDAFAIYGDPEVMRYLGSGNLPADPDVDYTRRALEKTAERLAQRIDGLGMWACEERATGRVVGFAGLNPMPDGEIEVFYQLAQAHWGRGIATEVARGALEYGFNVLGLTRIVAYAYEANTASINVLNKIGMNHEGKREAFDNVLEYFSLER